MRKRTRSLQLNRETLRRLDPTSLAGVAGGTSLGGLCESTNCPQPSDDGVSCQPNASECRECATE